MHFRKKNVGVWTTTAIAIFIWAFASTSAETVIHVSPHDPFNGPTQIPDEELIVPPALENHPAAVNCKRTKDGRYTTYGVFDGVKYDDAWSALITHIRKEVAKGDWRMKDNDKLAGTIEFDQLVRGGSGLVISVALKNTTTDPTHPQVRVEGELRISAWGVSVKRSDVIITFAAMMDDVVSATSKATDAAQPRQAGDQRNPWIERAGMQEIGSHSGIVTKRRSDFSDNPDNGAVWEFDHNQQSRIAYDFNKGFPIEGTVEIKIYIEQGYAYSNGIFQPNQAEALIFTTVGPDTWETGACWLKVTQDGVVSFAQCSGGGGSLPNRTLLAEKTLFRFKEWHVVSVSFGSQGRALAVDGQEVARDDFPLAVNSGSQRGSLNAGNRCLPTLGQMQSLCWLPKQHDAGFDGKVEAFRASPHQLDWKLAGLERVINVAKNATGLDTKAIMTNVTTDINEMVSNQRLVVKAKVEDDPAKGVDIIGNGDGRIQKGEAFELVVVVSNACNTAARAVSCTVTLPTDKSLKSFSELHQAIADLAPGVTTTFQYSVTMPLSVIVTKAPVCSIDVKEAGSNVIERLSYELPITLQ